MNDAPMIPASAFEAPKSGPKKSSKPRAPKKSASSSAPAKTGPKKMAGTKKSGAKKGAGKSNHMTIARPHGPVTVMGKSKVGQMPGVKESPEVQAKHVSKAAKAVLDQSHTFAALATAGVIGYLQGNDNLKDAAGKSIIPDIGLNTEATLGIAAFFAGKYMKSQIADHMATGLLSVGAWKLAFAAARKGKGGDNNADVAAGMYDEAHEAF